LLLIVGHLPQVCGSCGADTAARTVAVACRPRGEHIPIASNEDAEGRAVNRRVTITFS